jgi:tetratricopeptide (TPR) repeat protein
MAEFDRLVDYCPDYAEGYNQRAFIHYLRGDYTPALGQLDEALQRQPLHIAALAGKALTLIAMGREAEGQMVLAQALKLNPWLPERGLLRPELLGEEL